MDHASGPSDGLLDLIYDAASDGALWGAALTSIADLMKAQGGVLFGQSVRANAVYFEHIGRLSADCNTAYKQRHVQNAWSIHMIAQPVGVVVGSDEVMPLRELERTAF